MVKFLNSIHPVKHAQKKKWIIVCLIFMAAFFFLPGGAGKAEAASRPHLDRTSLKLAQGKTKQIKVKGRKGRKVTWTVSNKKILSVKNGKITALKGGKAVVTAKIGSKKLRCKVTVVGLNKQILTLAKKSKFKLKVKNGKNTKWKSSNKKIATVSKKGVVKAKKSGAATITCTSNGRKVKCKVYVASLGATSLKMTAESVYHLTVSNTGNSCKWSSGNGNIVRVNQNGDITAVSLGTTVVTCKSGKATLSCNVFVVNPDNIVTDTSTLPSSSKEDRTTVTVSSYPKNRSYTVFYQSADENASTEFEKYMPYHGCAACAAATVLTGFKDSSITPKKVVEKIEKKAFGNTIWESNYSKSLSSQMPMSLYGISRVLSYYGINNQYVRSFTDAAGSVSDAQAIAQITNHLKTGNPVVIEVSTVKRGLNSTSGSTDKKWSNSYHTMVLLGITNTGKAIVADSANRTSDAYGFGNHQRIKYETVSNLVSYMFSSTNLTSTSCYWNGKGSCGGYILVNP